MLWFLLDADRIRLQIPFMVDPTSDTILCFVLY